MIENIATSLTNKPDITVKTRSNIKTKYPGNDRTAFDFIFLFGVIASKWWINHNKKRIRVYLPESKRYLAQLLKAEWGGTISNINRPKHQGIMWQITSNRSLSNIAEAATAVKQWLPPELYKQLIGFTNVHS